MAEFKVYKSPWRAIRLILLCSIFVVPGILLLNQTSSWVIWLSIGFFGLGYPIGIFNLLDRRPQIIINETGIFDRTVHKEFINWELIQDAYPISVSGQKFICLIIDEAFKPSKKRNFFFQKVARWNEALGAQELNINLGQVKIDEVKLTLFIRLMLQADASTKSGLLKSLPETLNSLQP